MALVARSYVGLEQVGEPYLVGTKMYIKVKMANGNLKQVRAYSNAEYKKYYPDLAANAAEDHSNDPYWKSQKEILGFKNGYVTIFKGDTYPHKEWFKENGCQYKKWWGWSLSSEAELPEELPEGVEAIRLNWEDIGEGESLKNDSIVEAAVNALLYEESHSNYVGEIGSRIEIEVTVTKALKINGYYGPSTCYTMEDAAGNVFVWITSSTRVRFDEGESYWIRGTIKDHKVYKNVKQTVLTRCTKTNKEK